jgi:hypothetical protein
VPVRWLIVAPAVSALLIGGCGGSGDDGSTTTGSQAAANATRQIAGIWSGRLTQLGLAPFQIGVAIGQDGTATVAYTGIDCAGSWIGERLNAKPVVFSFIETIDEGVGGHCKGRGTVEIRPTADRRLDYHFSGGGVKSAGVLSRGSLKEVQAIWQEAGVNTSSTVLKDRQRQASGQ